MRHWCLAVVCTAGLALALGQAGTTADLATTRPLAAALAAKVPPDVAGLAALVGGGGPEAFEALLRLRTVGDERAVEALAGVLADHVTRRSTAMHGFAAGQALFCIGTPRAKEAVSRHLLSGLYRADLGIDYAFQWEMPPGKRDAFIEQYHLHTTSKALTMSLQVGQGEGGKLDVTLIVCNVADTPLRIRNPLVYQATMLAFRQKGGGFVNRESTRLYKLPPGGEADWGELAPGKCRVYKMSGLAHEVGNEAVSRWCEQSGGRMVVDFDDVRHFVGRPGKFTVQAMLVSVPPEPDGDYDGTPPLWCGRVVSEPVEIEIKPVADQQVGGERY